MFFYSSGGFSFFLLIRWVKFFILKTSMPPPEYQMVRPLLVTFLPPDDLQCIRDEFLSRWQTEICSTLRCDIPFNKVLRDLCKAEICSTKVGDIPRLEHQFCWHLFQCFRLLFHGFESPGCSIQITCIFFNRHPDFDLKPLPLSIIGVWQKAQ